MSTNSDTAIPTRLVRVEKKYYDNVASCIAALTDEEYNLMMELEYAVLVGVLEKFCWKELPFNDETVRVLTQAKTNLKAFCKWFPERWSGNINLIQLIGDTKYIRDSHEAGRQRKFK